MGLTFAQAFINSRVVTANQLIILEKNQGERVEHLKSLQLGKIVTEPDSLKNAELIVLAVKPQDVPALFEVIKEYIDPSQVILSIMAGISINQIKEGLGASKIIRAMPNLPSQIGQGMTAFTCTEEVTRFEQGAVQNLLATTGKTLNVGEESKIDVATAISGSGPAYIFYFMEAMIKAAKASGLENHFAETLVVQTFLGSLGLYKSSSKNCNEWIDRVASRGGTTEAAMQYFNTVNLDENIIQGIQKAYERAVELGGNA